MLAESAPSEREPAHPADPGITVPARPHFPCLDGLRTIAVMSAILQHVALTTGAITASYRDLVSHYEIGPVLFFMISGFLLYRAFAAASVAGRPPQRLGKFLRRRVLRVFPGYWLAIVVVVGVHYARGNPGFGEITLSGGWVSAGWDVVRMATLTQIYSASTFFHGMTQAWTLATEIGFYLFLPLYAFVLRRLTVDRSPDERLRVELAAVAVLYVFGVAWRAWIYYGWGLPDVAEFWLPGFLDVFGLGMGLAAISVWASQRDALPSWLDRVARHAELGVLIAVAAYLLMALGLHLPVGTTTPTPAKALTRNALNGITAFFLLLPAVFGPQHRGLFRRLMQWRPIAYMGLVSFGVYLYHEAWMNQARQWIGYPGPSNGYFVSTLTICVSLALLTAAISYRVVERPFLELKDKRVRSLWPNPWDPK